MADVNNTSGDTTGNAKNARGILRANRNLHQPFSPPINQDHLISDLSNRLSGRFTVFSAAPLLSELTDNFSGNVLSFASWTSDETTWADSGTQSYKSQTVPSGDFYGDMISTTLQPASLSSGDAFGGGHQNLHGRGSIATDGTYMIVGAPQYGTDAGRAFFFLQSDYTEQAVDASDAAANDFFGASVAISGSLAVVGAPGASSAAGAVYVFTLSGSTWTEVDILTASDGAINDHFGHCVKIDARGQIIVGAPGVPLPGGNTSKVYVFSGSGASWTEDQIIQASDDATETIQAFGAHLDTDGDYLLVGAEYARVSSINTGAVYFFKWNGSSYIELEKKAASDGSNGDSFGSKVSINGTNVVVAADEYDNGGSQAGTVYFFEIVGDALVNEQRVQASDSTNNWYFGRGLSISGNNCVITSEFATVNANANAGKAYFFRKIGGTWSETGQLIAKTVTASDQFGTDAVMLDDFLMISSRYGPNVTGEVEAIRLPSTNLPSSENDWTYRDALFTDFSSSGTSIRRAGSAAFPKRGAVIVSDDQTNNAVIIFDMTTTDNPTMWMVLEPSAGGLLSTPRYPVNVGFGGSIVTIGNGAGTYPWYVDFETDASSLEFNTGEFPYAGTIAEAYDSLGFGTQNTSRQVAIADVKDSDAIVLRGDVDETIVYAGVPVGGNNATIINKNGDFEIGIDSEAISCTFNENEQLVITTSPSVLTWFNPGEINADDYPPDSIESNDLQHVILYGQSLSIGGTNGTTNVSSTTPDSTHLMFNSGIRPLYDDGSQFNENGLVNADVMSSFVGLFESISALDSGNHGETYGAGIASRQSTVTLITATGRDSYSAQLLSRASDGSQNNTYHFNNTYASALAGARLAESAGYDYQVPIVIYKGGESEANASGSKDDFKTDVTNLKNELVDHLGFATLLNVDDMVFIVDQQALGQSSTSSEEIAVAAIELHRETGNNIICAGPTYPETFATVGDVHMLSPDGYRDYGEKLGLVVKNSSTWNPCYITSVSRSTTTITVNINVPSPPLVFDTGLITAITDEGFDYTGANITDVSITDATNGVIEITIDADASGNLRYAYANNTADFKIGPDQGPRGTVRDSAPEVSVNGKELHNYLCVDDWVVV